MDTNIRMVNYCNNNYIITKIISESENEYNSRINYIHKIEKYNLPFKEALRLSKIWYSIIYKHCNYPDELHNYVMQYDIK